MTTTGDGQEGARKKTVPVQGCPPEVPHIPVLVEGRHGGTGRTLNQVNGHYSTAVSGDSLEESFEGESLR